MSYRDNAYRPPPPLPMSPEMCRARRWMVVGAAFDAAGGGLMIAMGQVANGLVLVAAAVALLVARDLLGRRFR